MNYLNRNLSSNIGEVASKFQLTYLVRYVLILFVGFLPLFLLIKNSKFNFNLKFQNANFYQIIFLTIFAPSFIFYYIAQDWGRWVSISYTLSLFTYIFSLKNNFIVLDINKINFVILKNKTIVTLLFVVFAFGWSPKTLINEDVSSIPIYRKSVEIIKNFYR